VKRVRFIAPARREFLAEVVYYDGKEQGLGARFASAIEEAVGRALAFRLRARQLQRVRGVFSLKIFPLPLSTVPIRTALSFLRLLIIRAAPNTGNRVFKTANKCFEPTCSKHHAAQTWR
jgi:hypothetical protein